MVTCVNGVGDLVGLSVSGPALRLSSLVWLLTYNNQSFNHSIIQRRRSKDHRKDESQSLRSESESVQN